MIEVGAFARLHFGLFDVGVSHPWVNIDNEVVADGRNFGGIGLMIDQPRFLIRAQPATSWRAKGPLRQRVLATVERLVRSHNILSTQRNAGVPGGDEFAGLFATLEWEIVEAPPEHVGFGTGTQLELAVAWILQASLGRDAIAATDLARWTGRGRRSAVGVYGFASGGFIVEAGKRANEWLAPLVAHMSLPTAWRIVTVVPPGESGLHGDRERRAFEELHQSSAQCDMLCRLVLQEMIPSLRLADYRLFAEAVYEFNARVGELFSCIQGGRYAFSSTQQLVTEMRTLGIKGVGQSSWGPAVFAIVEDEEQAHWLRGRLQKAHQLDRCWIGRPAGPAYLLKS
jgi:beta-RFAP synthase